MNYNEQIIQLLYNQIEKEKNKLENEKFRQQFLYVCNSEYIHQMKVVLAIMNTAYHLVMENQLSRALRYIVILSSAIDHLRANVIYECNKKHLDFLND